MPTLSLQLVGSQQTVSLQVKQDNSIRQLKIELAKSIQMPYSKVVILENNKILDEYKIVSQVNTSQLQYYNQDDVWSKYLDLMQKNGILIQENRSLQSELQKSGVDKQIHNEENQRLTDQLKQMREDMSLLKRNKENEIIKFQNEINLRDLTIDQLNQECVEKEKQKQILEKQLNDVADEADRQNAAAEKTINDLQEQLHVLKNENEQIKQYFAQYQQQTQFLKQQIYEAQLVIQKQKDHISSQDGTIQRMSDDKEKHSQDIINLEKQQKQSDNERIKFRNETNQLNANLQEKRKEVTNLTQSIEDLKEEKAKLQKKLDTREEELRNEQMKGANIKNSLSDENENLKRELKKLKEENQRLQEKAIEAKCLDSIR